MYYPRTEFLKDNIALYTLLLGTMSMLPTQAIHRDLTYSPFLTATLTRTRLIPDSMTVHVELVALVTLASTQLRVAAVRPSQRLAALQRQ